MNPIRKLTTPKKAGMSNRPFRRRQRQEVAEVPRPQPFGLRSSSARSGSSGSIRLQQQQRPRRRSRRQRSTSEIDVIRHYLGDCQHHGTGNPLAVRAPTMPQHYAVKKLADVINNGFIGQRPSQSSSTSTLSLNSTNSTTSGSKQQMGFKLKTERGKLGSFWTTRLRLAGSYGWTGIILPKDADTSQPYPIDSASYFLVENDEELQLLQSLIDPDIWPTIQSRVITTTKLANNLKN